MLTMTPVSYFKLTLIQCHSLSTIVQDCSAKEADDPVAKGALRKHD
jgi:hypothetical protein